ncbi:glycosyltransferase [Chitinivorax sp. B]|uniref:glycosyltransferase n=1 Tax=Chitinivorax sp. B TaxID=2502235 RepID=UPI0010F68DD2|nr:glycosyltransferase [Chitinivorax sp. B]
MRLLYVVREGCDTKRPDVYGLFGCYLAGLGVESHLLASPVVKQLPYAWPGGEMLIKPRMVSGLKAKCWQLLFPLVLVVVKPKYDAVVVRDKTLSGLFFYLYARLLRLPFIFWVSYPVGEAYDSLATLTPQQIKKALYRLRGKLSKLVVDKVLIPNSDLAFLQSEQMVSQYIINGVLPSKLIPVPMCVEWKKINAFHEQIDWDSKKQVGCKLAYLGTLDLRREPFFMLQVLKRLRHRYPDLTLILIGDCPSQSERDLLDQMIADLELTNAVTVTGWLSQHQAWQHLCGNVIGLSPVPVNDLYQVSSPTKTIEYLALGVPAVVTPIPDQRTVIEESGAGLCADMTEIDFANAVSELLDSPEKRYAMAVNGIDYVRRTRTYEGSSKLIYQHLMSMQ